VSLISSNQHDAGNDFLPASYSRYHDGNHTCTHSFMITHGLLQSASTSLAAHSPQMGFKMGLINNYTDIYYGIFKTDGKSASQIIQHPEYFPHLPPGRRAPDSLHNLGRRFDS
jgi:hypothetical protein